MCPIEDSSSKSKASSKRKKSAKTSKKSWNDFTFVNLNLSKSDKEQVKELSPDTYAIDEWLELMLDDGHKLSVKLETKSGAYFATLTEVTKECPNHSLIMTSRAPTFMQSLLVLYFKCEIMLDGQQWPAETQSTDLWS